MADQPITPSGSRWEPDGDETPTTESAAADVAADVSSEAAPGTEVPTPATPVAGTYPDGPPAVPLDDAAEERRARLRTRAVLAGAATALTLGGGLAGFVIGHSTAGDDANGFRPANFQRDGSNQGPGSGQLGEGPQGQFGQQGPPSFGDDDGDGFGPPDRDGDSSSGGTTDNSTTRDSTRT